MASKVRRVRVCGGRGCAEMALAGKWLCARCDALVKPVRDALAEESQRKTYNSRSTKRPPEGEDLT